jgi:nucleoside-diphosphate-sugar epimerase
MDVLIGSTGFVGGHLKRSLDFTHLFHRENILEIRGQNTKKLICAGLPAEKWKANMSSDVDWINMASLAENLSTATAEEAILISTIDVYQPPNNVTELSKPSLDGAEAYGRNRAWFEVFFASHFSNSIIIRLPGLFGEGLKKNLIYDLINKRVDQFEKVNPASTFQFFDISQLPGFISIASNNNIRLLNVATEPISAEEIAGIFEMKVTGTSRAINYDMKTIHSDVFKGNHGYLQSKEQIKSSLLKLKQAK